MSVDIVKALTVVAMVFSSDMIAHAKTLELKGRMGFLSEWELSGQLAQNDLGEFHGQLSMKHTGLCTHDGPVEKQARIRLVVASRVNATISMDGVDCAFSAKKSAGSDGVLACPNSTPIPLTLNLQ